MASDRGIKIPDNGELVPNRLIPASDKQSERLALVPPGNDYSVDAPYCYYTINILLDAGIDCLLIDRVWAREERWLAASRDVREQMILAGAESIWAAVSNLEYRAVIGVGKSAGTYGLSHIIKQHPPAFSRSIWLTPSLRDNWDVLANDAVAQNAFIAIGTEDKHSAKLQAILPSDSPAHLHVIEGADHGLDTHTTADSVQQLGGYCKAIETWLKRRIS